MWLEPVRENYYRAPEVKKKFLIWCTTYIGNFYICCLTTDKPKSFPYETVFYINYRAIFGRTNERKRGGAREETGGRNCEPPRSACKSAK